MISKETENVQTSEEIENAFRAITAHQDRAYVTKDELYAVSTVLDIEDCFSLHLIGNIDTYYNADLRRVGKDNLPLKKLLQKICITLDISVYKNFLLNSTEPDEGDGGLLRGPNETLHRAEDGEADHERARLYRLYTHPLPELSTSGLRGCPRRTA